MIFMIKSTALLVKEEGEIQLCLSVHFNPVVSSVSVPTVFVKKWQPKVVEFPLIDGVHVVVSH